MITLFCFNYIYTGKLVATFPDHYVLEEARVVYDTGPLHGEKFTHVSEKLPGTVQINKNTVEAVFMDLPGAKNL